MKKLVALSALALSGAAYGQLIIFDDGTQYRAGGDGVVVFPNKEIYRLDKISGEPNPNPPGPVPDPNPNPPLPTPDPTCPDGFVCDGAFDPAQGARHLRRRFPTAIIPPGTYSDDARAGEYAVTWRRSFTPQSDTMVAQFAYQNEAVALQVSIDGSGRCSGTLLPSGTLQLRWTTRQNASSSYCILQPGQTYNLDITTVNYNRRFTRATGNVVRQETPIYETLYLEERSIQRQ